MSSRVGIGDGVWSVMGNRNVLVIFGNPWVSGSVTFSVEDTLSSFALLLYLLAACLCRSYSILLHSWETGYRITNLRRHNRLTSQVSVQPRKQPRTSYLIVRTNAPRTINIKPSAQILSSLNLISEGRAMLTCRGDIYKCQVIKNTISG